MIHSANSSLNQHPKSLNRIYVCISANVFAAAVAYGSVPETHRRPVILSHIVKALIDRVFVSVDNAVRYDVLSYDRKDAAASGVRQSLCDCFPFTLNDSDNGSLDQIAAHRASSASLSTSAHVGFVDLHRWPLQLQVIIGKQSANLLENAPCSFVGDASLALDLFCGDSAASGTHEVHRVEPNAERSSGFLEDGSCERIDLSAAMVAAVGGASLDAIVFSLLLALLAVSDAAGPALLFHVFETHIIAWKFRVECLERVSQVLRDALFDFHISLTDESLPE